MDEKKKHLLRVYILSVLKTIFRISLITNRFTTIHNNLFYVLFDVAAHQRRKADFENGAVLLSINERKILDP